MNSKERRVTQTATQSVTDQMCLESLLSVVKDASRVLILPHNDPDPDAIASALALEYVLRSLRSIDVTVAYGGIVGRAENRALVAYLQAPLEKVSKIDFDSFERIALVDSQPGAGNNPLPAERRADIVVDHHQPFREPTSRAGHIDLRLDVGATSTILTGYVLAAGLDLHPRLATALFYGIQTDTLGLGRRASSADKAAYVRLQPLIEVDELMSIQRAQLPREYFRVLDQTLRRAEVHGVAVVAHLGEMYRPDMAAEMADVLLRLEGIRWVMCSGFHRRTLYLSLRSTRVSQGAGQVAQAVVKDLGLAGGHGAAGGGQVPVGEQDKQMLVAEVRRRFLAAVGLQDAQPRPLIAE
jgi:nanoRNase/pAp phosphatase (c-di-AMP/oligoRNAs hydrolase)